MGLAAPGNLPPNDSGGNLGLPTNIPPVMVSFSDIRRGWGAIAKSEIRLLASDGKDLNSDVANTMIESTADKFNELMRGYGLEPAFAARLVADATKVLSQPAATKAYHRPIFLESLTDEVLRIPQNKGWAYYHEMPESDRLKFAGFLLRPPQERSLPWMERIFELYPQMALDISAERCNPSDLYLVDETALRRVARTVIEAGPLNPAKGKDADELWAEKGWSDYIITTPRKADKSQGPEKQTPASDGSDVKVVKFGGYLPGYNLPQVIEYLVRDVISYLSSGLPDGQEERNLDIIMPEAMKVMPYRKRLDEIGYYDQKMTEGTRLSKLQDIFDERYLS
jgi:hypothetical protein